MKKISIWGKLHKWPARFIIAFSNIALLIIGLFVGINLSELNISLPLVLMIVFIACYFGSIIYYPTKELKSVFNKSAFYIRQKSCDFMLAASTFCMIVYLSNRPENIFNNSVSVNAAVSSATSFPRDSSLKTFKTIEAFKASLKDETGKPLKWKAKKKLLKEQVRAIKKADDMSNGAKVALIILSVIVALGLLYLVAALSCSLFCGGSGGAAKAVTLAGPVWLFFCFF